MPGGRVAAITQCYQEGEMVDLWVKHYSRLVGPENLFVLDHGSDPPVDLPNVYTERIPRGELDERERVIFFQSWQRKLFATYDWVITVDTDEFIVLRPHQWPTFQAYRASCPAGTRRCVGVEVVDPGDEAQLDWHQPILPQRSEGKITNWSCKPALSSQPTHWEPGLHTAKNASIFDHNLWLFHLKYADETRLMRRLALTRSLSWSKASLRSNLAGSHRVSNVAMKNHLDGYRASRCGGTLDDYLATNPDPDAAGSPLMAIPTIFLPSL